MTTAYRANEIFGMEWVHVVPVCGDHGGYRNERR
jgi:hypothetical protein